MTKHSGLLGNMDGDWRERLQVIVDTMRRMSSQTEPQAMVREYSVRMRELVPGDCMLSITRRGLDAPRYRIARDSRWDEQPNPWRERHRLPVLEGGLLGELIYGDEPQIIQELDLDPAGPDYPYLQGMGSLFAVPVYDRGEAMNMVILLREDRHGFDEELAPEMVWTSNLFGRATHNLVLSDELRRAYDMVDRELKVIADLQCSLLPEKIPDIPGLEIATHYQPAARAGGDYYDFFPRPDGSWGILVGDVSGHGSPAAVLMAISHCLAHTQPGCTRSPSEVLSYVGEHLNRLYTSRNPAFLTAFYGLYRPDTSTLTYSVAGHPPPRLVRATGEIEHLDAAGGVPLGILEGADYDEAEVELRPGDALSIFTDGIPETFDPEKRMLGFPALDRLLAAASGSAEARVKAVLEATTQHARGRPADDDCTLVVAVVQ